MKIDTLELTKQEMNEAVQQWLNWRNIKVIVSNITTIGYPLRAWQVELEGEVIESGVKPPLKITSPEELGAAIEEGKL